MCKNNFEIYDIQQLFSSVTEIPPQKQVNQKTAVNDKLQILWGSEWVGCHEIDLEVESRTLQET